MTTATAIEVGVSQAMWDRLDVLSWLLSHLEMEGRRRVDVLEVGSYEGQSAMYFNRSISGMFPDGGSVTCVDPWVPYHSPEQIAVDLGVFRSKPSGLCNWCPAKGVCPDRRKR